MYREFLEELQNTVAEVLGSDWPAAEQDAWQRQCDQMYEQLLQARRNLVELGIVRSSDPD